jgi:hypothetical protein
MDMLTALRYYARAYLAAATQLATNRHARQWMESMDWRHAEIEELERHARMAASWASIGCLPEEALPLIASGITPQMVLDSDPRTPAEAMARLADRIDLLRNR